MLVRVTSIHYPGRPGLTALSLLGSLLFYAGLICGVLSLRLVFKNGDHWWITAVLLGASAAGFALIFGVRKLAERSGPRVIGTIDAATWAAIQAQLAQAQAAEKSEPERDNNQPPA